jgi:D-amino peptidase
LANRAAWQEERVRVYISADMEGISGLVDAGDVQPDGIDYERGRMMMTEDVNAAVHGAVSAGAASVVVNDAHGPNRNLLPDRLHSAAQLVRGRPKPMGMLEGLDSSHDAAVLVGYHSRAGTLGVMSHSFMGHEIEDMWLDDRPAGEIGVIHATAAALGVPVVVLTGDDTACAEMNQWDPAVTTVTVKQARDRFAAELAPVSDARSRIERTVSAALRTAAGETALTPPGSRLGAASPAPQRGAAQQAASQYQAAQPAAGQHAAPQHAAAQQAGPQHAAPRPADDAGTPVTLAVRWQSASVASMLLGIPGVTQRDSRTVAVTGELPGLYRLFVVFLTVAAGLTGQRPYC